MSDPRIIAIGDGIRTDILGAQQEDIDSLFITGGFMAAENQDRTQLTKRYWVSILKQKDTDPFGFLR
jgi:ribonucleotide monophosphatase NagD (HAD superfamily)